MFSSLISEFSNCRFADLSLNFVALNHFQLFKCASNVTNWC